MNTKQENTSTFAKRLNELMLERGMNQSDLSRATAHHMPAGKVVNKDSISRYARGMTVPSVISLHAIAKVLKVDPGYLLPDVFTAEQMAGMGSKGTDADNLASLDKALEVKRVVSEPGMCTLYVRQKLPWEYAIRVMQTLQEAEDADPG